VTARPLNLLPRRKNQLDWFVKVFSQHGNSLEAGQFVMTGTVTGLPRPSRPMSPNRILGCSEL
jgi:2-keto-4-pentenoate hydratase